MATLLLSAAGAALGGGLGGSFAGIGAMALGKAVGATVGSVVDQKLLGSGSEPVEAGRVERFRVMGSSEGAAIPRVFGRVRVAGQIIWSSRFLEHFNESDVGGKGGGGTTVREYSYTVSLAIALCEGPVIRVGRIWADGQPIEQWGLNWRLHTGDEEQIADPLIAAIEGINSAPCYRGTAYIVFEDLDLTSYGNRIPQFNFEVFRRPAVRSDEVPKHPADSIQGVALIPGTGEYALATEPINFERGKGESVVANVHNDLGLPDIVASLAQMQTELPRAKSVSLVVTWFGDDLRAGRCKLRPKVEQTEEDADTMAWSVAGVSRASAKRITQLEGRPLFGGSPTDASVLQAIAHAKNIGLEVMFYPFILMDIIAGNGLQDPWSGAQHQPAVPWRGRITLDLAPGQAESSDRTTAAADEIARFMGICEPADFYVSGKRVVYSGPDEWSYRRFILHNAALCKAAGGVKAFCIGSELRGLTQVRDGIDTYPFVRALCQLASDVRAVLGADCKIGYAADWSEYFGHRPDDGTGDVIFHLDPLWSNKDIDFIGIDNYMPISDWRRSDIQADADAGSIYNIEYLKANVSGGEGYDWYYPSQSHRDNQERVAIRDTAHGEDWIFRYKDIHSWWSFAHHNRVSGRKIESATGWVPRSKPIWFTEFGCPAVDNGTNQPNVFFDPKSSESFIPYYSSGAQDNLIQIRYLQAVLTYWEDTKNNPDSDIYEGKMVDLANAYVWAWDVRPWPDFPDRAETWVDGENYRLGHWLNGRCCLAPLDRVMAELGENCGASSLDVSSLYGVVTGYSVDAVETGRQSVQPLLIAYGLNSHEQDGRIVVSNRRGLPDASVAEAECATSDEKAVLVHTRTPLSETPGRIAFGFVRSDADYAAAAVEAAVPEGTQAHTSQTSFPIVLSEGEARAMAERWLSEGCVARDAVSFQLPPSRLALSPGDVVRLISEAGDEIVRIDKLEDAGPRRISAIRVDPSLYDVIVPAIKAQQARPIDGPTRSYATFLDLPLLKGDEVPYAPFIAVAQRPWRGSIALYSANEDYGFSLNTEVRKGAVLGDIIGDVPFCSPGSWANCRIRVRISSGKLQTRSEMDVLNGANAAAIRSAPGMPWEVIQFCSAELIEPLTYSLGGILRGQAGTDAVSSAVIPAGAEFVLLDSSVVQINLPASARGLDRHYRYGPASRSYDDDTYRHFVGAFTGVGLRPYAPVHLTAVREVSGDIILSWVRRTRIDGDSWEGTEVPLGEDREQYHVRVLAEGRLLREATVQTASFRYSVALQTADAAPASLVMEVAQLSDRFGPGPYGRTKI